MRRYAERVRPLTAWVLVVLASQGGCQGKLPPAHDTSPFSAPRSPASPPERSIADVGSTQWGAARSAGRSRPGSVSPAVGHRAAVRSVPRRGRPGPPRGRRHAREHCLVGAHASLRPDPAGWAESPALFPALFARAIALGFDSAGRPLGPTMPRYQIDAADAADLVAFLRRLDDGPADAGVSADLVPFGLAPGLSPLASRAVAAAIEVVNRGGGVFRRRLELVADAVSDDVFAVIDVAPAVPWPDGGHAGAGAAPVVGFQPDPWVETGGESGHGRSRW